MTGQTLWFISRATGTVSLILFTTIVVLGMVIAGRRAPHGDSATIVMGLHRWLSLGSLAFLALHIVTAIADGYVSVGWLSTILPFTSVYRTFWVGLGTLAVDILLAVVVTSYLRHRMPERSWKAIHWLSYAMWPFALIHGFAMGTASEPLLRWLTVLCGAAGAAAVAWRLRTTHADRERRALVNFQEWS